MADAPENAKVKSVLEDPSSQAIARVYANAFLNAGAELEEFASFVDDVLTANPEFDHLLTSGLLSRDEAIGIIDRVVGEHGSGAFANFLKVLAQHDRLGLLPQILEATRLENEKRNNQQRVHVLSAQPLDAAAIERVQAKIAEAFDFEPIIIPEVDPTLIGGLVIRVGNSVYDGSLRSRLNQLAKRLQQRSLHEIQSGRDRFGSPEGD